MHSAAPDIFVQPAARPDTPLLAWLAEAQAHPVSEPNAVAMATANRDGIASNRVVQILDASADGLLFATHDDSPKGQDFKATGWASCVFYWREQGRQMIVAGHVSELDSAASDRLWAARPAASHAMSTVSHQSAPLADVEGLRRQAMEAAGHPALPRPARWRGYRLSLEVVEFWAFAADRLYPRLKYQKRADAWHCQRLQP